MKKLVFRFWQTYIFWAPLYIKKKVVFGVPSVCVYIQVCASLAPEQSDKFYSLQDSAILTPKIGALQIGPKMQNNDFPEYASNNSD
jgi:hypothetical protein